MQDRVSHVLDDIVEERKRQDSKWGEQNHEPFAWMTILMEEVGEACQQAINAKYGSPVFLDNYREELIQVAAVAIAAIECLSRKKVE